MGIKLDVLNRMSELRNKAPRTEFQELDLFLGSELVFFADNFVKNSKTKNK